MHRRPLIPGDPTAAVLGGCAGPSYGRPVVRARRLGMRMGFKVLLPLAAAGVAAAALLVVGGGSAAPQRAFGGSSPSPTHYQNYPVADYGVNTELFPDGGTSSNKVGLAITSLTMDNSSSSKVTVGVFVDAG